MDIKEFDLERTIHIDDEIDSILVSDVERSIQKILDKDAEVVATNIKNLIALGSEFADTYIEHLHYPVITIYINSPGGEVNSGLALYDFIRNINENTEHKIRIIGQGTVASMATIVMLASEERYAYENTRFLVHSVSSIAMGKSQEIKDELEEVNNLRDMMYKIYFKHTNISREKLDKIEETKKDWWFGSSEANELGLIKSVIK